MSIVSELVHKVARESTVTAGISELVQGISHRLRDVALKEGVDAVLKVTDELLSSGHELADAVKQNTMAHDEPSGGETAGEGSGGVSDPSADDEDESEPEQEQDQKRP